MLTSVVLKLEYSMVLKPINTMAADALVMEGTRSSATVVLNMLDKQVLVFHQEEFQLPVPSQCRDIKKTIQIQISFLHLQL